MSIFLPRLIHDCFCHWHHSYCYPHRHCTYHVLMIPPTPPASSSSIYFSYHMVLYIFPLFITWRAAQTISQSTSIFAPPLIHNCPFCQLHPHLHPHQYYTHCILPMQSKPPAFSSISYLLHRVVLYIFLLGHGESCTNNLTKHIDRVAMSHLRLSLPPV